MSKRDMGATVQPDERPELMIATTTKYKKMKRITDLFGGSKKNGKVGQHTEAMRTKGFAVVQSSFHFPRFEAVAVTR
ncbi:hypothetical protein [Paraburkholderia xenovorans]|jgi:hypothetical protein